MLLADYRGVVGFGERGLERLDDSKVNLGTSTANSLECAAAMRRDERWAALMLTCASARLEVQDAVSLVDGRGTGGKSPVRGTSTYS